MKLYFAIIIIALNSALGIAQEAEFSFITKPKVKLDKIKEGEQVKLYYVFQNSGETPLIISDYKVTCSCTKAVFPKHPIVPGGIDSILVEFDSDGKAYWQDRLVEIESNAKNKAQLRFKVYVVPKEEND